MRDSSFDDSADALDALSADELVARFNRAAQLLALAGAKHPIYEASYGGGVFYLTFPRQVETPCARGEIEQGVRRREALLARWRRAFAALEQERAERAYWAARDVITTPEEDDSA